MADWTNNNRACKTLWTSLFTMHQLSTNFDDSGDLTMKDLLFFNPLSSGDLRKQEATVVADELDNIFRNGRGADFEQGIDRTTAMENMVEVLADEEKSVADLASVVDAAYRFRREHNN